MDFSLTTLFVVPSGTLATTGSTQNLTAGQAGVYREDYTIATAGNIAAAKYVMIAQGRSDTETSIGLGSKRSDKITNCCGKIIEWYKVCAVSSATTQIQVINGWNLECSQQITFSFVLHSSYIDTGFYNGLTRSLVVDTPCCDCGANPCADISGIALQNFVDEAVAKGNAEPMLSKFLTFSRVGTGSASELYVTEKPLTIYGNPCDLTAYPWEYDRLWFRSFVRKGPATTQDFLVADPCDIVAVSTVLQRS